MRIDCGPDGYLSIHIHGRSAAPTPNGSPDEFVDVRVECAAREFRGAADCRQQLTELQEFRDQLLAFQAGEREDAMLDSGEGWYFIRLAREPGPDVSVDGFMSDGLGDGNTLRFRLRCDPAELPALVSGVENSLNTHRTTEAGSSEPGASATG